MYYTRWSTQCQRGCSWVLFTGILALMTSYSMVGTEVNLPIETIDKWAEIFGGVMYKLCSDATALRDIKTEYLLMEPDVQPLDGAQMVQDMKLNMEKMLSKKVNAIRRLVDVAEEAHAEHSYSPDLELSYPNAKHLNLSVFPLEENEHFNYIPVSIDKSTVHVPTNVYDQSADVVNGVEWSEKLDDTFKENYERDPTLTWQYFGSASGFFRNYPGSKWKTKPYEEHGIDVYDCRNRGWYIQAATSPKDIVILLDSSGSMKGLRMEIAKATVEKILNTLSDDDFFNVIKFSDYPEYVDDCFNGTLVQANADNKKRVQESLNTISTQLIAHFDKALVEAFQLLRQVNESGKGAQCNRAIMIITDGAPETYEEVFAKYNWPEKNVRVFTYLIGREVGGEKRQVRWMACVNKGYFSHISTLADIHEHVQEYIHVLSRPMVIKRANHTIWTSVYSDAAGLQLMTSVAQPVFNTKNSTESQGKLLGVMGTDVPLKELTKLTPKYKLGVNGYAFAITNNGYILFHPDFRPLKGNIVKPNYNSVDLSEVELSTEQIQDPEVPSSPSYDMELRREMVDRNTGNLKMKVKIHYNDMKRVTIREQHYYYTDIAKTPFSLGIALPEGYGQNWINGTLKLEDADLLAFRSTLTKIAPWSYCNMDTNETRQDQVEMLIKYLQYGKNRLTKNLYEENCDTELIESLLFDAEATRGALSSWMKENRDGTLNDSTSKSNCTQSTCTWDDPARHGVELVFLGTKAGLTRYVQLADNLTDPDFIESNTGTVDELYYKRAVEGGSHVFTFSIPFDTDTKFNWNSTVVTASTPIIITKDGRDAVAAVTGLQLRYDKFYEFFINTTRICPFKGRPCNYTCDSNEIDCYLLDDNGFVILSEDPYDLGKFFGTVDSTLMRELIIDEERPESEKGVYKRVLMHDYQGICDIWRKGKSSATSIFVDPIRQLISSCLRFFNELVLFFVQFNLYGWWHGGYSGVKGDQGYNVTRPQPKAQEYETEIQGDYYVPPIRELYDIATEEEIHSLVQQWKLMQGQSESTESIRNWFEDEKQRLTPTIVNRVLCTKAYNHFTAEYGQLPFTGILFRCEQYHECTKPYRINRVPGTNLLLLVVDAGCDCLMEGTVSVEPVEVKYNDTMMCQRLQTEIYRKRPSNCFAYHPNETDPAECGQCSLSQPSLYSVSLLLMLYTLVTH